MKEYVARKNVSFRLDNAVKLAEKIQGSSQRKIGTRGATMPVSTTGNYLGLKPIIDDISEQIIVNVQNDSDTSSFNSIEENEGKEEVLDEESV